MNRQNNNAPCTAQEFAPALDAAATSDRLYRFAAMTVVLFMLATML